jgi:demethylmenaquinone methyltransferase/2-methoxy-6-polyprenyl-1,4-benzoquinol methylase
MAKGEIKEPRRIRGMFNRIAHRYDLLNHLLSANFDRRWRRLAARELSGQPGLRVLDLCGGTGDLSIEVARSGGVDRVVCCDFAHDMLTRAAAKFRRRSIASRCLVLEADGLRLPFVDASFDAVTVGFGVRNFVDLAAGLGEILRVLRPGGRLVILEFSTPSLPLLDRLYGIYLGRILPRLGDRVAGNRGPYGYLARTIVDFPDPAGLAGQIREAGFAACGWTRISGGIVAIHTAFKAPPR